MRRGNKAYQLQGGESPLLVLLILSHEFILIFSKIDVFFSNVNTFLKSVSTSKSRVTYDLDTDTTAHKIIGVVGSPLLPRYACIYRPSEISSFTVISISKQMMEAVENIFTLTVGVLTQTAEFFYKKIKFEVKLWVLWVHIGILYRLF